MAMNGRLVNIKSAPKLRFVDGRDDVWELAEDFSITLGDMTLKVPKGFVTDLASIPKRVEDVLPEFQKDKLGEAGPLIHDFIYSHGGRIVTSNGLVTFSREDADVIFLAIMLLDGVNHNVATLAFFAVREFAWYAWKGGFMNIAAMLPIAKQLGTVLLGSQLINKAIDNWVQNNGIDPSNQWDVRVWHAIESVLDIDPDGRAEAIRPKLVEIQNSYNEDKAIRMASAANIINAGLEDA